MIIFGIIIGTVWMMMDMCLGSGLWSANIDRRRVGTFARESVDYFHGNRYGHAPRTLYVIIQMLIWLCRQRPQRKPSLDEMDEKVEARKWKLPA